MEDSDLKRLMALEVGTRAEAEAKQNDAARESVADAVWQMEVEVAGYISKPQEKAQLTRSAAYKIADALIAAGLVAGHQSATFVVHPRCPVCLGDKIAGISECVRDDCPTWADPDETPEPPKSTAALCGVCGQPMPPGEEMFKFHGYSGPCPE